MFQVIFSFANNVSRTLAADLNELGIHVEGELIDLEESSEEETSDSDDYDYDSCDDKESDTIADRIDDQRVSDSFNKLFLDITCMMAYVSSMTNGGANYIFPREIYNQQVYSIKCIVYVFSKITHETLKEMHRFFFS